MNRIIKHKCIVFFATVLCCFIGAKAQVSVEATIDSAQIFIGQQVGITLEVSANAGSKVEMPKYDSLQQIIPGIEYVSSSATDTSLLNDGKRMLLSKKYLVTSFDSALYYLPPIEVKVDGKVFKSKNLALKVYTVDIDTLHADSIYGLKAEMYPPFSWDDWSSLVWLSIVVLVLAVILIYVIVRLKDNKPIIKRIKLTPKVAPHKAAMQQIEHIKEEKIWQSGEVEDSKEYYTQLTDTLRKYISERFGFNAMEMTSYEIINRLTEEHDEEALSELRELFMTADLVKFAKYNTLANENDRNLVNAIEYINSTKKEEEVKPQPEEIVVVEAKSRMAKYILVASIAVASLALVCVVGYMVYRIVFLSL